MRVTLLNEVTVVGLGPIVVAPITDRSFQCTVESPSTGTGCDVEILGSNDGKAWLRLGGILSPRGDFIATTAFDNAQCWELLRANVLGIDPTPGVKITVTAGIRDR